MNNHLMAFNRFFRAAIFAVFPVLLQAQTALDSLPPIDSLTDYDVNEHAQKLAARVQAIYQSAGDKAQVETARREALEQSYALAKSDSTVAKTTLDSLQALLKSARSAEKKALALQKQAQKTLDLANTTAAADNLTQRKNLSKVWKSVSKLIEPEVIKTDTPPAVATEERPVDEKPDTPKKSKKKKDTPPATDVEQPTNNEPPTTNNEQPTTKTEQRKPAVGKKYDPAADVMVTPPNLPCVFDVKTRDEFSGEIYQKTAAVELFRQTPSSLKSFLQGKPNVRCEAALASSGANVSLVLTFTINDPNPRKSFGRLEKNSQATLLLIDGAQFILFNQTASEGILNPENQSLVYQGQYPLTPEVFKKLRRTELDKIRIAWSSGYEDYEVQFVHLLMQLGRCF